MTTNTQGASWEEDKQDWLDTFDQEYGDILMSKCIGIVSRGLYHKMCAPSGADASYITRKLHEIASKERAEGERRGMEKAVEYMSCKLERQVTGSLKSCKDAHGEIALSSGAKRVAHGLKELLTEARSLPTDSTEGITSTLK